MEIMVMDMDKSDMIGILIVAVVAVGSVAFMMGVFSAPSDNLAGEAMRFTGTKSEARMITTPPAAARSAPTSASDVRTGILSRRARGLGSYISTEEIISTLRRNEYNGKNGHQVCQMLGYQECSAVQWVHSQWFYESSGVERRTCDRPQLKLVDHYLDSCTDTLAWGNLHREFDYVREPSGACRQLGSAFAEPMYGHTRETRGSLGILCQK